MIKRPKFGNKKYVKYNHHPHLSTTEPLSPDSQPNPNSQHERSSKSGANQSKIVEYSDVSSDEFSAPEAGEIDSDLSPAVPPGTAIVTESSQEKNNSQGNVVVEPQVARPVEKPPLIDGAEEIEDDEDDINKIMNNDEIDSMDPDQDSDELSDSPRSPNKSKKRRKTTSESEMSGNRSSKRSKKSKRNKKSKKRKKNRSPTNSSVESISDSPLMDDEECLTPPIMTHRYEKSYTPNKDALGPVAFTSSKLNLKPFCKLT